MYPKYSVIENGLDNDAHKILSNFHTAILILYYLNAMSNHANVSILQSFSAYDEP